MTTQNNGFVGPLPEEIIIDILSRLPADCVRKCQRVCKKWSALTSTTYFKVMHRERAAPVNFVQREQLMLLELLEKWQNKLHIEELNLEKRADDALTALRPNAQFLILGWFGMGSNVILQGSMSCADGVLLSSLTTISLGLAFLVAMSIAYNKIQRLVTPVAVLKQSLTDLHRNVLELKNETEHPGLITQTAFGSNFSTRIQALEQNHQLETTDFLPYYKRRLVWILIAAVVHCITSSIVTAVFFCKGKDYGNRAPKFALPTRPT
ncbi:hypothetical protein Acr_06g0010530 [Actinidia rufa]|uniref:F-box domain-containing protein n=1 Tax=Actinidia rufa TaxID=165716 RepID=A0A7J0ERP6_9ERIC|nr:hypothetical protein Acr_06g0010530 [Actinidia rufa]